jgi:uncharacterized membrane protein
MTLLLVLLLLVAVVWLAARVSDLGQEVSRLRREVAALAARTPPPAVTAPADAPAVTAEPRPASVGAATPVVPAPPPRPPSTAQSLESLIGGRWLLYIGMATILIGASYFVKLAFDNEWITPSMRVLLGGVVGLLLVGASPLFRRRGYALYGQILAGGGVAILYICVYAAFNYYALIGSTPAFLLMLGITGAAAALADRAQSQGLALMAVGGGFVTPFLVSSGRDAQVALFGYDAVLVAATMVLARRRNWPALNAVSFVLTVATIAVWADAYYGPERWATTWAFLTLFVAMFIYIRHESRRWGTEASGYVAHLLVLAPVLYHLFSLAILGDQGTVFLAYLVIATATGLWVNARAEAAGLRLVLWFAVMLPFFAWAVDHRAAPLAVTLASAAAIYVMHAAAQAVVVQRHRALRGFDIALLYVSAMGLYFAIEVALEFRRVAVVPVVALALGAWYGALAARLKERFPAVWVHGAVLAAAFGAIAVARQFDGPAKPVGWAVLASGLLWLGLVESSRWLRICGALLLSISVAQLVRLIFTPAPVSHLVLLNPRALATLFVVALMFALGRLYRRDAAADTWMGQFRAALLISANLLALALITTEIHAFWSARAPGRSGFLALHVMTSLAWALYAVGLIVIGIRQRYAPVRYLAMAVLGVTILKVFLLDLAQLDQAYRVLSAIGLGVLLLIASFLYQRFRAEEG